ncbi:hypothetical protein PUN28_018191 [Cardiocondyla obscurior]|uniref:Uncharacterized protein n=1 Tax=Cardiocondyla obscurior TaxID=286306 RepID=A0AAW2EK15_9HYME
MATTTGTEFKRITRQSSRKPPVKTLPERTLKPKKVITAVKKNSKKTNISINNKSLQVTKKNVSLKSPAIATRLRLRKNRKNYCDDSRLLQQYISPKQQNSKVVLKKLTEKDKVPVYKTITSPEKSSEDKNDVYDFKFDLNDTREKFIKKKSRKKIANKGKRKITRKKVVEQPKLIDKVHNLKSNENISMDIVQNSLPFEVAVDVELTRKDNVDKTKTSKIGTDIPIVKKPVNKNIKRDDKLLKVIKDIPATKKSPENTGINSETSRAETNVQLTEQTTLPNTSFVEQVKKKDTSKPRIISVENANNIVVTKSPPNNTEGLLPFRPKNIFDNKIALKEHNSTLKCSMTKTLSPIQKISDTIYIGSPWRPSHLMFSQTKHFIQSTPYRNFETHKEKKEVNKKTVEVNKENNEMNKNNVKMDKENVEMDKENMEVDNVFMEVDKENMEVDKENVEMNKENISRKGKEKKAKKIGLHKKKKKLLLKNQAVEKQAIPAPVRVSLGEIKNFLRRPNVDEKKVDEKKIDEDEIHTKDNKLDQKNNQLTDFLNFSDTFDIMSETERLSNINENCAPLFMDLEPSHFSNPPRHSYKRKRVVKFDFSDASEKEDDVEEIENRTKRTKKKKPTKTEREQEQRVNEWIKTVNTTFQEIDEYDLVVE